MDTSTINKFQVEKTKKFNQYAGIALMVLGLVSLITGAALGYAWANIVSGLIFMGVGALGVYIMLRRTDIWSAMILFRTIVGSIAIVLLLAIINLSVGLSYTDVSWTQKQITDTHNGVVVMAVLTILLSIFGVGTCAYCAKMYVEDLNASMSTLGPSGDDFDNQETDQQEDTEENTV